MRLKRPLGRADHRSMPSRVTATSSSERGYTLVELLVAATVLVMGGLGAFTLLNGANRTTVSNNARMGATNLAREVLETARSVDYDLLNDAQMDATLQAKVGNDGTPWKIQRRGIEYTVEMSVCTFDDPKDNIAATPPADVCTPQAPVPAAAGTLEPENQPDDFRRVTVKLTWDIGRGVTTMNQTALVNNPSGGMGPRITKFTAPPDNVNQFAGTATSATFPTETTRAASVRWNSDGSPTGSGDSTGGPLVWDTTWQLGSAANPQPPNGAGVIPSQYTGTTVLDGTYTVTAQAFDERGVAGDSRAAVLPLNRSFPITVTGFELGRNDYQGAIEFQWDPNPERDIIGYEVWNSGPDNTLGNGNDSLSCSTASASATSCVEENPPAGTPAYYVVALDKTDIVNSASAPRKSPHARVVATPATAPAAPLIPILLPVALDASTGKPQLNWAHLNLGSVRFFRIYRDQCCDVDERYDATPGNATSWVDPNPGPGTHRYWVTAVGPTLNESSPSNSADSL
jgi:type II secretory pathway pseudopilin PulG